MLRSPYFLYLASALSFLAAWWGASLVAAAGGFGNSCMSCHFNAGTGLRDYSWGFARRPHQDAPPSSNVKVTAATVASN